MTTDATTAVSQTDPVAALFREQFPSVILDEARNAMGETMLTVARSQAAFVLRQAKEKPEFGFDFLRCLTGVDQQEQGIELIYSLYSFKNRHKIHIKVMLPAEDPTIESITPFWVGADWHEREAAEMFGVTFVGHPNPKHLLLDDDMTIHPLLKAHPLAPIELKQGVETF
jgi:NADH-quinone oxidoreductase subunit C